VLFLFFGFYEPKGKFSPPWRAQLGLALALSLMERFLEFEMNLNKLWGLGAVLRVQKIRLNQRGGHRAG
jgi:hypothetical protein